MGYYTYFHGRIDIEPPLNWQEIELLKEFADERHGSPVFPGNYCDWVLTEDAAGLEWNESESFRDSAEWMKYLIDNFLGPDHKFKSPILQGHKLNGIIEAEGEENADRWDLIVTDNVVTVQEYVFTPGELKEV